MAKISKEEYWFLNGLNDVWKWIAKDKNTLLWVYKKEPSKYEDCWDEYMDACEMIDSDLFQFIQWEDEYPYSIAELIEEYEKEIEEAEVKKDKKRLLEKLTRERNETNVHDPAYQYLSEFIKEVNQLEEPEVEQSDKKIRELESYNDDLIRDNNQLRNAMDNQEVLSQEFINEKAVEVYVDTADAEVHVVFRMRDLQNLLVPKKEITYEDALKVIAENIDTDEFSIGLYLEALNNNEKYEFLTEEWIELNTSPVDDEGRLYVWKSDLQNAIVPKQELPEIPSYVADWIEKYIEYGFDLYPALKRLESNQLNWKNIYDWYRKNTHKFVNAYLTGKYEVETERKYLVNILDEGNGAYLIYYPKTGNYGVTGIIDDSKGITRFTEQEIKSLPKGNVYFEHFAKRVGESEENGKY